MATRPGHIGAGARNGPASNEAALAELSTSLHVLLSHTPKTIVIARKAGPGWTEKIAAIDRQIQVMLQEVNMVRRG